MTDNQDFVLIDGTPFPRETDGMVLVDAYYVPKEEAAAYIERREACAEAAINVMREWCAEVCRDWAGSQDGEAVLGRDKNGELICLVHLDPQSVDEMSEAMAQGQLKAYLQEINGLATDQ